MYYPVRLPPMDDSLKELGAVVDRKENVLLIKGKISILPKAKISSNLNYVFYVYKK